MTDTELRLIASAAIIGDSNQPVNGNSTAANDGIAAGRAGQTAQRRDGRCHDRIARRLSISKGAVAKYLSLAGAAGLDWALTVELDEASLERRVMGGGAALSRVAEPDYARVHIELRRKGVTLMLLWAEYRAAHEGQRTWAYTQFCDHCKVFAKHAQALASARRREALDQLRRTNPRVGRWFARASLHGRHGRVELHVRLRNRRPEHALVARRDGRALSFHGGAPQLIVPDNPRALVSEACRYEPKLNQTVNDFARHYGVSILPARPYSPKDKAALGCRTAVRHHEVADRARPRAIGY